LQFCILFSVKSEVNHSFSALILTSRHATMQVHFLRYLNKLHSDDYFAALDNLLRYFDYR